MTSSVASLLLVEDNAADVRLTREAFRGASSRNQVHVVGDGEMAMAFLRREDPFGDEMTPDLVLLDLNLPRMGGREVLAEMRSDPALKRVPVVVLSTSTSQTDVDACYDLGANCYVVKPVDFSAFVAVVGAIDVFWLRTARFPTRNEASRTPLEMVQS